MFIAIPWPLCMCMALVRTEPPSPKRQIGFHYLLDIAAIARVCDSLSGVWKKLEDEDEAWSSKSKAPNEKWGSTSFITRLIYTCTEVCVGSESESEGEV